MNAELLVARFVGLTFLVVGLSHLLRPAAWVAMFRTLDHSPWSGLLLAGLYLPQGLLVILTHNVWAWTPAVIVSILGWGMTVKGTIYLFFPQYPARIIASRMLSPLGFRVAGGLAAVLGALVSYDAFLR